MQQWNQIQVLGERGLSDAAIARKLSLDRETVAKWNGRPAPIAIMRSRASKLDAFLPYLAERLADFPELSARKLTSLKRLRTSMRSDSVPGGLGCRKARELPRRSCS